MDGVGFSQIPGFSRALARARENRAKAQKLAWIGASASVCGFRARAITVLDYVALEHHGSPFVNRIEPTMADVAFFLWTLSEARRRWNFRVGFRGWLPQWLDNVEAFFFSRRVRRKLWRRFDEVTKACFMHVEAAFADAPPESPGDRSGGSGYLATWFAVLQHECSLSEEAIWTMPIAQLFQRIKIISARDGSAPDFSADEDALKARIQRGLCNNEFTVYDLQAGLVDFSLN